MVQGEILRWRHRRIVRVQFRIPRPVSSRGRHRTSSFRRWPRASAQPRAQVYCFRELIWCHWQRSSYGTCFLSLQSDAASRRFVCCILAVPLLIVRPVHYTVLHFGTTLIPTAAHWFLLWQNVWPSQPEGSGWSRLLLRAIVFWVIR